MPQQQTTSVENNFTKGLVTEFTGLNFPENAATDADNVNFSIIGDTDRRLGVDFEPNSTYRNLDRSGTGINSYKWNNVGGDGNLQIVVVQSGGSLFFYRSSSSTISSPLSTQWIQALDLSSYVISGNTFDVTKEATFSDGNGYLFVFHPDCNPFYCLYTTGSITSSSIDVRIRDFSGVVDNLGDTTRPSTLGDQHKYNLTNQGWIAGSAWIANSTVTTVAVGSNVFTVQAGLVGVAGGQSVSGYDEYGRSFSGTVTGYVGTSLTINVTSVAAAPGPVTPNGSFTITPLNVGYLSTWQTAVGNYPSNSDVWWFFKNASGVFDPATTVGNVTLSSGKARKGHYIISAFNQNRASASGIPVTTVSTTKRPTNGAWFQGRIWYTGVDAQQPSSGDAQRYTWTGDIYFSQVIQTASDFGNCFQTNDPTSENFFDLLPTDGGVIKIQEAGTIYKLFPIQNGMLVFAANGIWFITGSQGIGFTANDYTVTNISEIKCISGTSFVNVNGLPYFWNEEGVYSVQPSQGGSLTVESITVSTIFSLYDDIPLTSKKYARGAYDPTEYTIRWVYRDTEESNVLERYTFNRILCYNTFNKAFYTHTVTQPTLAWPSISGILYVANPPGSNAPPSGIKYVTFFVPTGPYALTFSEENNEDYVDWYTHATLYAPGGTPVDYDSYFVTGYRIRGQASKKYQTPYIYVFSNSEEDTSYKIQGIWDYASNGNSGRWSSIQLINNTRENYRYLYRRHRIRGQGMVLQIKVSSVTGEPFSIIGWSTYDTVNQGV